MDNILWNKVVEFHGHACPGLAIGFQASLLAKEILEINNNIDDEDIVCIAETDACGVDAVQVILKATIGTGSLRIDYKGKQAFNFYNFRLVSHIREKKWFGYEELHENHYR